MRDPQYMYLDYLLIFNWAEILRTTSSTGAHARHWCTQLYILCIGPIYTTQGFSFYQLKCNFLKIISSYKEIERMDTDACI